MKKIMLLALLVLTPALAHAGSLSWTKGDFSVSVSTSIDLDTVGAYDFNNNDWLTGVSKDLLVVSRKERRFMYLAGEQMFSLENDGKAAFGAALGIYTGSLAQYAVDIAHHFVDDAKLPKWVATAGNYLSIEGGYSRRFFGTPDGQSANILSIGGKVRIPLDKLWAK